MKKAKIVAGCLMTFALVLVAALSSSKVANAMVEEDLKEAHHCSFVIPSDFVPGEEKDLFLNRNYPMESSMIAYNVLYNGNDIVLTNREKEEHPEAIAEAVVDNTEKLTKDKYLEIMSQSYNKAYGEDVGLSVTSFENVEIDGFPGYKVVSEYQKSGEEKIHQTVVIVLSKYRTFTITYQRAEDDDCEALFEKSIATIHVK